MSEALKSVINFGFKELKLDSIEAFTHKENENSKKLSMIILIYIQNIN